VPPRTVSVTADALERVARSIVRIRGRSVILDTDLAALYGTSAKRLNEQVRRNAARFPDDFMFRLTDTEFAHLRSQFATSSASSHGGRRHVPLVFSEHGAIMAANVVKSARAIKMSIVIVRAFVRLRHVLQSHAQLARKLDALESKYDEQFAVVFEAIRGVMLPAAPPRRRVGFHPGGHRAPNETR
jgi:hypothetical protein